ARRRRAASFPRWDAPSLPTSRSVIIQPNPRDPQRLGIYFGNNAAAGTTRNPHHRWMFRAVLNPARVILNVLRATHPTRALIAPVVRSFAGASNGEQRKGSV